MNSAMKAAELPIEIRAVANHNLVVHNLIQAYAHGQIITKEEVLCQMVIALSKDWSEAKRQAYESYQMLGTIGITRPI